MFRARVVRIALGIRFDGRYTAFASTSDNLVADATTPPRLSVYGRYAANTQLEPSGWALRHDD